jgi:hypothetical protein
MFLRQRAYAMKNSIPELVFGVLVGATLAAALTLLLFSRDLFPIIPTLVPSAQPLPTAESFPTAVPPTSQAQVPPTESPSPATPTPVPPEPLSPTAVLVNLEPVPVAHVMAVGDSVMLGGALELRKLFGDLDIDALVGRQPAAGIDILRTRRAAGTLGGIVIIHLGNNGPFTAEQIDEIMGLLASVRQVVFVNVKVPRRWEGPNNIILAEKANQYPNVVLVDWYGTSVSRPDLFYEDGVHLRPEGAKAYAALIAAVLTGPQGQ